MAPVQRELRRRPMPPRRPPIAVPGPSSPAPLSRTKTSGVGEHDLIRLLRPAAVRLYRDGQTVGAFCEAVGDYPKALRQLYASYKAGLIAIQAGRPQP